MKIPNIQEQIEKKASDNLDRDINILATEFKAFLDTRKQNITNNITIKFKNDTEPDNQYTESPFISQLFICTYIRNKIREYYLSKYIQDEINRVINNK